MDDLSSLLDYIIIKGNVNKFFLFSTMKWFRNSIFIDTQPW
jgi:hypothetical protein